MRQSLTSRVTRLLCPHLRHVRIALLTHRTSLSLLSIEFYMSAQKDVLQTAKAAKVSLPLALVYLAYAFLIINYSLSVFIFGIPQV